MNIYDALKQMADDAGDTLQTLSVRAGHSRNYIHALRYQQSTPNLTTLNELARLCGYEIHLVGHGRDIKIDAPDVGASDASNPHVVVEYLGDLHSD